MLFSFFIVALTANAPERSLIDQVPSDWYESTTRLFEYCVNVKFQHPICPQLHRGQYSAIDFESEFFTPPVGPLNAKNLFQATVLYEMGRAPEYWLVGLGLEGKRPPSVSPRLWAEAQYLWARVLFDRRKYEESLKLFDKVVDEFKGRAIFHQQRAWTQFFNKKFDSALGSIVSAESPLIYKVAFFEKHFLRALIEKETCQYPEAISTIAAGRKFLSETKADASEHPWVVLCDRKNLGTTCNRLREWYTRIYETKVKAGLDDLDLLEIELRDRLTPGQKEKSRSEVVWPFVGEAWRDELGYYSVPIKTACAG